jgi:hypothetical protein
MTTTTTWLAAAAFGVAISAGNTPAVDPGFWSFLPTGRVVTRCEAGSRDQKNARASWERLRDQIGDLGEASDPTAVLAALRDLLRMRCFELAAEQGPPPIPSRALALRTWWEDGGYLWLWSYVEPMQEGQSTRLRDTAVLPPDARTVLSSETPSDGRLAPLLCSESDALCGLETRGWVERARTALVRRPEPRHWFDDPLPPEPWQRCETAAGKAPPQDAYTVWRNCLARERKRERALPLGRTRAPKEGWLIISGRRGHYEFCDGIRAYDLATGSAYRAESCSALVLEHDGAVDFGQTDAHRNVDVHVGRVVVDNIREAAWMLMLRDQAEDVIPRADTYPIPQGIPVRYRLGAGKRPDLAIGGSGMWSSALTTLTWTWDRGEGTTSASGELTWPESADPAETHAASLLAIAESGFEAGCPPTRFPIRNEPNPPGVSALDAEPRALWFTQLSLWKQLTELEPAGCKP